MSLRCQFDVRIRSIERLLFDARRTATFKAGEAAYMKASTTSLGLGFFLAVATLFAPTAAQAQTARAYNLPAQALAVSLRELGSQARINVIFDPAAIDNRRAPLLRGSYDLKAALAILLQDSGFTAVFIDVNTVVIKQATLGRPRASPAPSQSASKGSMEHTPSTLRAVVVTGIAQELTATRSETPLNEVAQSVSLVSQDTLDQQNASDMASALQQATGITLVQSNSQQAYFYSRGFQIDSIHLDGGAPLSILQGSMDATARDLSEFDGIEVLRGADALFGGMGNPGATVSLHRKEPTDVYQGEFDVSAGSWNQYRLMGDVSGPLVSGLSGRLVATGSSQDYFYNIANQREGMLYGVLKYTSSPATTLTLGASYESMVAVTNFSGLPWYDNGDTPLFSRSTSLTAPWAHARATYTEAFLKLDHCLNDDWRWRGNATLLDENLPTYAIASFYGPISSTTGLLSTPLVADVVSLNDEQLMMDTTLTGAFDWWGQKQEVMVGGDFKHEINSTSQQNAYPAGPLIDPFAFDPSRYPESSLSPDNVQSQVYASFNTVAWGVYGAFRFHPFADLAITVGGRLSEYRSDQLLATTVNGRAQPTSINDFTQPTKFTPYASITYDFSPHITLYASYADIYHTNNGELTRAFTPLAPSDGVNVEAGAKGAWFDKTLNASLALFKIDQSGNGTLDPTMPPSYNCCFVTQSVRSKGMEAEVTGAITPNWQITAGYTYDIHRSVSPYYEMILPRNLLKVWTTYTFPQSNWSVGGGVRAQSTNFVKECMATSASDRCLNVVQFHQGFYPVVDVRIAHALNSIWNVALSLNNIFDRRYYQTLGEVEFGNWYGAPRSVMVKLQGKF